MTAAPPPPPRDGEVCACGRGRYIASHADWCPAFRPAALPEPPAVDSPTAVTCNAHETAGCAVCFGRRSAPSPVDTTEPPAETQQDGRPLGDVIYTAWTGQPYWGGCDQRENVERVLDALAARPSADTETLPPVRAEIIRQVREAAWHDGYEACRRGDQPHNPYRAALDAR